MGPTTVSRIVSETCESIWTVLKSMGFLKVPSSYHEWKIISQDFSERWNYPHAIGALQAPHQSGSTYFNYKKTHSIVMRNMNLFYSILEMQDIKVMDLYMLTVIWDTLLKTTH